MPKRRRSSTYQNDLPIAKKHCLPPNKCDHISHLSSELLIRILHNLPIETLLSCHSVSRHFYTLSHDSQVWKSLYYSRFVLPRALRIPGIKNKEKLDNGKGAAGQREERNGKADGDRFQFSSRRSRWLDEEGLRSRGNGRETNWKRQYKLRHNWARGACEVKEIDIAEKGSVPGMFVRLAGGVVITVGEVEGLKAWDLKGRELITICKLEEGVVPTCFAVDEQDGEEGRLGIVLGFEDGGWGTWELNVGEKIFVRQYRHPPSSNGMLSGVAYAYPYILSITKGQLLSFYTLNPVGPIRESDDDGNTTDIQKKESQPRPYLLTSLQSHSSWPPLSLSIRLTPTTIIASIAYTLPTYLSGYTISIQELHFSLSTSTSPSPSPPTLTASRLTSSFPSGFHPLTSTTNPPTSLPRPTTLSYAHPYILATHPDNTLSLYLCTSTRTSLTLSPPQKLFGHTSSISFASITSRGKAVSVSERGGELRVWELEPGVRGSKVEERSVRVWGGGVETERNCEGNRNRRRGDKEMGAKGIGNGNDSERSAVENKNGDEDDDKDENEDKDEGKKLWVGFDEEMVIVLKSNVEDSECECEEEEEEDDDDDEREGNVLSEHNDEDEDEMAMGGGNRNGNGTESIQQRLVIYDFT
ncbi:hypothetical protein SBOR_6535 [Sclerotinia borealis F-4128]|uniref:F-box domain-containing protein n=1 Tax=Sclerotinia borealis (strain F-4128) TaxID=1432307 RepID=W9CES7_SCLBF|nr:hypothetical protein SBOR_6535 [Sclerotinia borealis F-4128]